MAKHTNLSSLFTAIADAIRTKKGLAAGTKIVADNFPDEIAGISTGVDVTGIPTKASEVLKTAKYMDSTGTLQNGSIERRTNTNLSATGAVVSGPSGYYSSDVYKSVSTTTQATPSISVSSSGLITAIATQSAGYVSSGSKEVTKQLSSSDDADFIASNIKSGVTIFGVQGTYSPSASIPKCSIKITCADHIPNTYGISLVCYTEYYSYMQTQAISPLDIRTVEFNNVPVGSVVALVTNFDPNIPGQEAGTFEIFGSFGGGSYFVTMFCVAQAAANSTVHIILSTW